MADRSLASIVDGVVRILREEILSVEPGFDAESNLVDSGLDSLALTQLMLAIEEQTGIWVDESLLTPENLATAATLGALVHSQLDGS